MKQLTLILCFALFQIGFSQIQTGKASFYADKFEGRQTASGEIYTHNKATAAHRKLAFGTKVRVTNLANNKSVIVVINDRGPFIRGRIIDLSKSAAQILGFVGSGVADVNVEVLSNNASQTEITKTSQSTPATSTDTEAPNRITSTAINNYSSSDFYSLKVNQIQPDFIGVQIGSFKEMANLIRMADRLKLSYNESVTVQVKTVNETRLYSLILGNFGNRLAAERFIKKISKDYPDAFIVDMQ
ncbi:septal ring lytic transglycosylase RlpA family protein [Psychroflexus sp. ALD_RP9]|uniref:septal ring lytic transglycosylase RlpA family protein n=1 Tax=Psychroflexus sp. ALD_RP9 TaxID=2777186 RepID=UPI001A8E6839|nr:septal ring lytic transglycosylase RlpA family protein [Psychroflexus sp. ALD_RP9]QSS97067.1 septal ring lytic transglycosylase RlpA family protein [Psychroflexus sp. ALD_RP9]